MPDDITQRLANLNFGNAQASTSQSVNQPFTQQQLQQISLLINQAVNNQNNPVEEVEDEPALDFSNPSSYEKIPDVVKCLREFTGKPGEFNSWKKSVDRILEMYESVKGTAKYHNILHVIRHKIVGDADTALESYRTPLDWKKIKKCLMMHYSDKRDISTLEYQLTTLTQNYDQIAVFYQKVYQHLSLILDKIDCLELSEESLQAMTNAYRDKALDTFIRGLNGDLPRLLSVREPSTLPQALHMCLKLDNMNYRLNHAHNTHNPHVSNNYWSPKQHIPQVRNPLNYNEQRAFHPELTHWPQIRQNNPSLQRDNNYIRKISPFSARNIPNIPNQFSRPPLPPKSVQRPEPMDVDQSLHSRQVNYQNRPNDNGNFQNKQNQQVRYPNTNNFGNFPNSNNPNRYQQNAASVPKRQASQQHAIPNKLQRNYHIQQETVDPQYNSHDHETFYDDYNNEQVYEDEPAHGTQTSNREVAIDAEDRVNFLEHDALPALTSNTQ